MNVGKQVKDIIFPDREPDHYSKRGVPYWFAPEWVRSVNDKARRIVPVKVNQHAVDLHGVSIDGNVTYIRGSIQREFKKWHEDRQIDYILLGISEEELLTPEWFGDKDED